MSVLGPQPQAVRVRTWHQPFCSHRMNRRAPLAALPTIGAERIGSERSRRSAPRGSAQAVRNAGDTYITGTGDIGHLLVVNADYAAKMQSVNWQLRQHRTIKTAVLCGNFVSWLCCSFTVIHQVLPQNCASSVRKIYSQITLVQLCGIALTNYRLLVSGLLKK